MKIEDFIDGLNRIGIKISDEQLSKFNKYFNFLVEYNKNVNLTRIVEKEEVYLKHFYDSATIFKTNLIKENSKICDLGSGAGFPGIVIKILCPNIKLFLVDSSNKRVTFLEKVVELLELENAKVIHSRGEDFARSNKEMFDIVTCRAVSELRIIGEICIPMLKINGYFLPLKGNVDEELKSFNAEKLGATIEKVDSFLLPIEESVRSIVFIKKKSASASMYPRKYDQIVRKPL